MRTADESTTAIRRMSMDLNANLEKTGKDSGNVEKQEKLKYPMSIFFIFSNEFCERFSYYGMRTVLALYLQEKLGYSEDLSTIVYHIFVMLCYFSPVFGGIVADSWLGKFRTILYMSIVYALGNVALSWSAFPESFVPHKLFTMLGLLLIAICTGGIKPCVSSFGGDQFVLPQQQRQLESFFSIYYFSVNAGSVISSFLTPMLREMPCLGQDNCYPLAFGVPAILMILSIVFFISGRATYTIKKPEGRNIAVEVTKCCSHAVWRKIKSKGEKKNHWLDYADDKYSEKMIRDCKILIKIIILFSPTIVFWALYEQQGSRWTFQASHMDGRVGSWIILPDQIQTLNPVLCLLFIPIFEKFIYPFLNKVRLVRTPLQKLSWGGFMGAIAFFMSGLLQLYMQPSYPVIPGPGESQLRIFNNYYCDVQLESDFIGFHTIKKYGSVEQLNFKVPHEHTSIAYTINSTCFPQSLQGFFSVNSAQASSYILFSDHNNLNIGALSLTENRELEKSETANPKYKIIYSLNETTSVKLSRNGESHTFLLDPKSHQTNWNDTTGTGSYSVIVGNETVDSVNLEPGGMYIIMVKSPSMTISLFTITEPNNINILWQVPQYVVITFAEIMFSITGIEFSFTQSPDSLKSIMSSIWLVMDAFGNLIILFIAGLRMFNNQAYEFFLFGSMMTFVMFIFVYLAVQYKYEDPDPKIQEEHQENTEM